MVHVRMRMRYISNNHHGEISVAQRLPLVQIAQHGKQLKTDITCD